LNTIFIGDYIDTQKKDDLIAQKESNTLEKYLLDVLHAQYISSDIS
jgi:hypothetical protein